MSSSCAEDEARRKALKPQVDLETAVAIAREVWGLELPEGNAAAGGDDSLQPKPLDSYDDNNFFLPGRLLPTSDDGEGTTASSTTQTKFLLKVQNGVESGRPHILAFQNAMMAALHAAGIQCPRPVPLPGSGSSSSTTEAECVHYRELPVKDDGAGGHRARLAVRLLRWVEGTPMVDVPCTPRALVAAGAYLGGMDLALDGFDHPGAHREHLWDIQNFSGLRSWVGHVQDPGKRRLVLAVLDAFDAEVKTASPTFRRGVLMGDWNDANILVDPQEPERVVGAIDFGDSTYSWRVAEVAVAMAYAAVSAYGKQRPVEAAACLLKGYVRAYPLLPAEHPHLLVLACARLATSVTLGAFSYARDPSNKYLLIHAEPAWAALHTLWYSDRAKVQALFARALQGDDVGVEALTEDPAMTFPVLRSAPGGAEGER